MIRVQTGLSVKQRGIKLSIDEITQELGELDRQTQMNRNGIKYFREHQEFERTTNNAQLNVHRKNGIPKK